MSDKVKQLAPAIWEEIQKANKILLHCHVGPDADSYGSTLAMMYALKNMGKTVTLISGDSEPLKQFSVLPGFSSIEKKSFLEIDQKNFDLFLVFDSSSIEQISKLGKVEFLENLKVIIIDHHKSNPGFGYLNLIDSSYPAVCQLLYDLMVLWKINISSEIAICLFLGIYSDTGGFKYSPVSTETFAVATDLTKIYPNFAEIVFQVENNKTPNEIIFEGIAFNSIQTFLSDKVAISMVTNDQLSKNNIGAEETHTGWIASSLVSVKNWEIGIALVEKKVNDCWISFRTRGKYDMAKIAVATGFGNGHPASAGAKLKMPPEQAKKFLLEKIQEVYPDLRQGN
ncbi:bifunctional oligoribonuclease/PAP phosphatase NrnA [Candidatus Gottesmanbacteria bacterium]|nr:bifunctional oligoribonuclease/PAP phosphatase NrnA [Candidatus Gottesmanbacteria bacterium]